MASRVLDTNVLIRHRHRSRPRALVRRSEGDARTWARRLIDLEGSDAIVTPVYIEFISGVTAGHELKLARAFLGEFRILDRGHIPDGDWQEASRIAGRIPRDGKPRQLGDCLVRAIANRLRVEVRTFEVDFPR